MATSHVVSESHRLDTDASSIGSTARRLVYALALVPIVPAIAIVGMTVVRQSLGFTSSDELRVANLLIAVLFVGGTIFIWRKAVLWTLGRKWLTALVAFVPFVQVIYAQPLWNAGCVSEDILRVGQHELGVGLWVWLSIWVWWGWEKTRMEKDTVTTQRIPQRIPPIARRLAASIGTIPFVFGIFMIMTVALEDVFGSNEPFPEGYAVTALIAIGLWILIWRNEVAWSPIVIRRTVVGAIVCLAVPIAVSIVFQDNLQGQSLLYVTVAALPVMGWGAWMADTMSVWSRRDTRESAADRSPRCLNCGYLLIGLRATRCPECGDEPTLDELWRASLCADL